MVATSAFIMHKGKLTSTHVQLGGKHVETTEKFCGLAIHTMETACVAWVVIKDADIK
jgi:hypothetical protein